MLILKNFRLHRLAASVCAIGTVATLVAFFGLWSSQERPTGSSPLGLTLGIAGGLIIVFEMLLWVRKKLRGWRGFPPLGSAQWWMRWHIWLGILSLPLIVFHTGLVFWGGAFATALLYVFIAVIASGIFGLVLQNVIPRRMIQQVPEETIYSQIEVVAARFAKDAETLVAATCGTSFTAPATAVDDELVVIGAPRSMRSFRGKALPVDPPSRPVPNSELLQDAFNTQVKPFLIEGRKSKARLQDPHRSKVLFDELRDGLDPAAHETVKTLEKWVEARRQLDVQARLQFWLHSWLAVHAPLSLAMFVMMLVHAYFALKYSGVFF